MAIEAGDTVFVEYTGRLDDGTVFDTTRRSVAEEEGLINPEAPQEFDPMKVEAGEGELIDGFEDALMGQEEGDEISITLEPEEAYGDWDEELTQTFSRSEIEQIVGDVPLEEGTYLQTKEGALQEILHVDDLKVEVDFNHRLAGETLHFDIEIVEVE